ncbi:DnaJ domain-containing protein [Cinnamomum micranthum f. kanehirae]|uniref:DnaJ domain-containing protein n=1 Tax=Cinnamomum micranthum f. kanehirae TaxID=337451 RepID=A0A3S3QFG0_9MAGN|nr:DnaJ domain-containing protein [Cinnamomum micranthum f. kanehirae]
MDLRSAQYIPDAEIFFVFVSCLSSREKELVLFCRLDINNLPDLCASGTCYVFSLNHARLVILMSTIYAVYCVKVRVGWLGVFLSVNLAFFSNELFNSCSKYMMVLVKARNLKSTRNQNPSQKISLEIVNILALLVSPVTSIDVSLLRKEYRRKAMLVHPDKNMESPLASESFKKLQCAYEVLSDSTKKRSYDEQCEPFLAGVDHRSEESRCIRCTKCGNSHLWICTNRTKAKARWCQECFLYHPAKDGDGWVEKMPQKVEIPRAFVCAESKIFDVSEWASCQGVKTKTPAPPLERPPLELRTNLCSLFAAFVQETPEPFPLPTEASIVKAAAG